MNRLASTVEPAKTLKADIVRCVAYQIIFSQKTISIWQSRSSWNCKFRLDKILQILLILSKKTTKAILAKISNISGWKNIIWKFLIWKFDRPNLQIFKFSNRLDSQIPGGGVTIRGSNLQILPWGLIGEMVGELFPNHRRITRIAVIRSLKSEIWNLKSEIYNPKSAI